MKKSFFIASLLIVSVHSFAQSTGSKPEILYGAISKEDMLRPPFDKWFVEGYDAYQPDTTVISSLRKINMKNTSIRIFLGTWCGDSRREVPRFLKILHELSFPLQQVHIIAVGGGDSLYKQSPQHEETGKGIFRVPVFILYKNDKEIGRINEYPSYSLEKDMLALLSGRSYIPNYRSFETIRNWLADGTMTDKNITARSLAWQLKPLVGGENELNSLGYLLLKQDKKEAALKLFQVNAHLYPESSNVISSLGEGYYETGDQKNAVQYLERSLELNKDPQKVKELLGILYKAKGIKE
ncbi:MAG: hypothetical protein JNK14_09565 [Chitinophagaceae bacterium]|nr:hypothetical protein [Chitinophagaceae bacterium]